MKVDTEWRLQSLEASLFNILMAEPLYVCQALTGLENGGTAVDKIEPRSLPL